MSKDQTPLMCVCVCQSSSSPCHWLWKPLPTSSSSLVTHVVRPPSCGTLKCCLVTFLNHQEYQKWCLETSVSDRTCHKHFPRIQRVSQLDKLSWKHIWCAAPKTVGKYCLTNDFAVSPGSPLLMNYLHMGYYFHFPKGCNAIKMGAHL